MTTIFEDTVTCAVCGEVTRVTMMGSTNQLGYPDLDLRPPEMMRSTIFMWLQECPACGYCAEDIEAFEPEDEAIVRSDAFVKMRQSNADLNEAARRFRVAAFIAAERGAHAAAFEHTLHEAWVHDDCNDAVRASAARLNAVDLVNQVRGEGSALFDDKGADAAMAADLLRRAGEFDRSDEVARKELDEGCPDHIQQVLKFELQLCAERDAGCHTMEEVGGAEVFGE